jgi:hypothetical protein
VTGGYKQTSGYRKIDGYRDRLNYEKITWYPLPFYHTFLFSSFRIFLLFLYPLGDRLRETEVFTI